MYKKSKHAFYVQNPPPTTPHENRAIYKIVEKYGTAGQVTDDNIIGRMRFHACWISKATDTHSEYVTLIDVPWQQWLRERVSMLRYSTSPVLKVQPSGT